MNAFFNAQFNYCPLILMLHSRHNNNRIKHLHETCLRLIQNDKLSSYKEPLEKDGQVSIQHKNIQSLAIEMFQIKHGKSPEIVSDIFAQTTQHYNFRQNQDFRARSVKSVYHGSESISYLGPKIREIVPAKIKVTNSLNSFKIESVSGYHKVVLQTLQTMYQWCWFFFSNISIIKSFFVYVLIIFRVRFIDLYF